MEHTRQTIVVRRMEHSEDLNPRHDFDPFGEIECFGEFSRLSDENVSFTYELSQAFDAAFEALYPVADQLGFTAEDEEIPMSIEAGESEDDEAFEEHRCFNDDGLHNHVEDLETLVARYEGIERFVPWSNRLIIEPFEYDGRHVGFTFVTHGQAAKEFGVEGEPVSDEQITMARALLSSQAKTYAMWLAGELYEFGIYTHEEDEEPEEGEVVDSCCGFFSEEHGADIEKNGMAEHWPDGWRETHWVVDESGFVLHEPDETDLMTQEAHPAATGVGPTP